jgi:nucleoside-diphosphate-sugar epimerase
MKYLVLGSSGVIGNALCNYLRSIGEDVLTFDIESDPSEDLRIHNNVKLENYIQECDFVFFMAWDVGGSVYLQKYQDSYDFILNNMKIISNTFECIKKYNKPFIFASSQMANMSYSTYGITKALAEKLVSSLGGLTVKFWNVYGEEHDLEKSHVITDFILKAKKTGVIDMLTDGLEQRQMLYSSDCAECLYVLSTQYQKLPRNEEYHITSFEWVSVYDIAKVISNYFPGTQVVPAKSKDEGQKDKRNQPDPSILKYWKPKTTLVQGIETIIKNMGIL